MLDANIAFDSVGVTRFELATTRPPDAYSNRAELHPATKMALSKPTGISACATSIPSTDCRSIYSTAFSEGLLIKALQN